MLFLPTSRNDSLQTAQPEREETTLLLQKIRLNNSTVRDVEGVHMVKTGLPPVREDEIEEILEQRRIAKENERAMRIEDDLRRRQAEYYSTLMADRADDIQQPQAQSSQQCSSAATPASAAERAPLQDAMPLADVDGRAVLLAPLKTLFRITLIRCRVQERLSKIKESTAGNKQQNNDKNSLQAGHRVRGLYAVAKLPVCSIEEEELPLPAYDEIIKDAGQFSVFHNFESFEKHDFRVPFRFKTKNYTSVRFPEFCLDLTAEAAKEVDMFHVESSDTSDIPTLRNFTQPVVTLERFKMPPHAYHLQAASRYGEFEKSANYLLSQNNLGVVAKKTTDPIGECAATSAIQMSAALSALPPKLNVAKAEDSLSDSDSDDGTLEHGYQPDLGWVPKTQRKNGKSHSGAAKGKPGRNANSVAFIHFMEKYTSPNH